MSGLALALAATVLAAAPQVAGGDAGVSESRPGASAPTVPGTDLTAAALAPLAGETVITASRAPRLRSEVPADVTVLDRSDLEQSASPFLDDVLRRVPEVGTFRRSSSRVADPSSQGLNLRGVGPSGVSRALVLVDGHVPAGSTHVAFQGRLEAELSPHALLGARLGFFDENQNGGTEFTNAGAQVRSIAVTLALGPFMAPDVELAAWFRNQVFRQQRARVAAGRVSETLAGEQRVPADDEGFSVLWHAPRWGVQSFDVGLDLRRVSGSAQERVFPSVVTPTSPLERAGGGLQLSAGLFVQDTIRLGPVTIVPGLRVDHWHNEQGRQQTVTPAGETVTEFPSRMETLLSPRLAALWQVVPAFTLRGSVNRAFRAPTLGELYRPFQVGTVVTAANPDLAAETLIGAEMGFEWAPAWFIRSLATAFWNQLDQPIVNLALGPNLRQRENLGSARVQGIELGFEVRPGRGWEIRAAYTTSTLGCCPSATRRALRRRQRRERSASGFPRTRYIGSTERWRQGPRRTGRRAWRASPRWCSTRTT